jgi:ABC-2 type transport system permease protein
MGEPTPGGYSPLLQLTLARFREFYREPAAIFWVYGFPLLLAILLGFAFRSRPVERIRVDIVTDGTSAEPVAERMRDTLAADERLHLRLVSTQEGRNRLRTAKTDLVVTPGTDGRAAEYLTEPNRPEAVLARNAVDSILLRSQLGNVPKPPERVMDETGSRYIDFLIPGLIGTNLMGGGLFGIGFLVVDLRVRKLLKRFLATPMRKRDFLLSLVLSRLLFTLVEIFVLLVFARLMFGVRVYGDLFALSAVILAGSAAFSGIGLLLACRAKTIETVSGLMNAVMLPMYLLSGVFFSYERFPEVIHPVLQILPLTATIDGLRVVMTDGGGLGGVVKHLGILTAWAVVTGALALKWFRWR